MLTVWTKYKNFNENKIVMCMSHVAMECFEFTDFLLALSVIVLIQLSALLYINQAYILFPLEYFL